MSGAPSTLQPSNRANRLGPARARALARQRASEGPASSTAWLQGSHEALLAHPEWQQLQAHLQELIKVAVRRHLDESRPQLHAHTIEAARQIYGDVCPGDEAMELFQGKAWPHLLHEPYMSAEGATGLLGQTLAGIARKVDQEAEARHTLESPAFRAFRSLVGSIYVGGLQKRAAYVEGKERLHAQTTGNETTAMKAEGTPPLETGEGSEAGPSQRDNAEGRFELRSPDRKRGDRNDGDGRTRTGKTAGDQGKTADNGHESGKSCAGYQACSGDIAQALVAIAMGEGFESFASTSMEVGGSAQEKGGTGKGITKEHVPVLAKGRRGVQLGGAGGTKKSYKAGGSSDIPDRQPLLQRSRDDLLANAAAGLRYFSEDVEAPAGDSKSRKDDAGAGAGSGSGEGRFPGLEWLAPYIVGRVIPMDLRRELWQRTLLRDSRSPTEVEQLVIRYAGEKGIVDPTNTPIAGMVTTGVRHWTADALPWLSHGGDVELELRQRTCRGAEELLNKYFVFVGKHSARHVAFSVVLAYVFSQAQGANKKSGKQAGEGAEGGGGAATPRVALLHSLFTRFAPDAEDLRGWFRTRAYGEIRNRDPPLCEHLLTLFPAYKYGIGEEDVSSETGVAAATPPSADESKHARGLVETLLEIAFVGYLGEDALLFVWDQLFLLGWKEQLPLFVADITVHLRASLLSATKPRTLLNLAREACRRIYTRDLRDVFRRRRRGVPGEVQGSTADRVGSVLRDEVDIP